MRRARTNPADEVTEIPISEDELTIERGPVPADDDEPVDDDGLSIEIGTIEWRPPAQPSAPLLSQLKERIENEVSEALAQTHNGNTSQGDRVSALLDRGFAESRQGHPDLAVAALDMAMTEAAGLAPAEAEIASHQRDIAKIFDGYLDRVRGSSACTLPTGELLACNLDPESAFLLSRADGHLTIDDIIDVSGMPRLEASRHLCRLVMNGLLIARLN